MKILHNQRMTDELLATFLDEVEQILNNRSIVTVTEDPKN